MKKLYISMKISKGSDPMSLNIFELENKFLIEIETPNSKENLDTKLLVNALYVASLRIQEFAKSVSDVNDVNAESTTSFEQMLRALNEYPSSAVGYRAGMNGMIKMLRIGDSCEPLFYTEDGSSCTLRAKLSVEDLLATDWIIAIGE